MDKDRDKALSQSIGRVARAAREALGLTQDDVAERVGISGEFYARLERGNALPSVPTLNGIARVLNVSADEMLGHVTPKRVAVRVSAPPPDDPPEIRRLARQLRKAQPSTLRLVERLLKEIERTRKR